MSRPDGSAPPLPLPAAPLPEPTPSPEPAELTPPPPVDPAVPVDPALRVDPAPPVDPAPVVVPPRVRWRRTRRTCLVLAGVGLLAAGAGTVVAVRAFQLAGTPEAAVSAYFAAVARGDAGTALAAGAVPAGGRVLVTDDVLRRSLALAPVTDVRTGSVSRRGGTATVAVSYRIGGATPQVVVDRVPLVREDGRWRLRESAVPVGLEVQQAASWAAVPASRPFAVPTDTQLAFPGAVPVFYRSPRLQVTASSAVVRFASTDAGLPVSAELSARGRAEVTAITTAALRSCAAGGGKADPFCPQPDPGRADDTALRSVPRSFHGTLPDLDHLDLDLAVSPDTAGVVAVSGSVGADGNWQVLDYDDVALPRSGRATIGFAATVPVGSGAIAWERS